jgi:photosystem II stability/assembly factor-like uncharacterized protein
MGALFTQMDGPPNTLQYLGCHDLGDTDAPEGDVARTFCPDPINRGRYNVVTRTQGAPGEVTGDVSTPIGKTADYLEMLRRDRCRFPLYVPMQDCGRPNEFIPNDRGLIYTDVIITGTTRTNTVTRNVDGGAVGEMSKTFAWSAEEVLEWHDTVGTRRTTALVEDINDVVFCNDQACQGICGPAEAICTDGVTVFDAGAAATADVQFTTDGGVTWTTGAVDPFAADEHISTVVCFPSDGVGTIRVIVGRGSTDAGNPAEIGYTEDSGATWTAVNVGATNGELMPWNGCLFAWDRWNLWACTDTGGGAAGNIYVSRDGGATWALQLTGAGDALNCVRFSSVDVGLCVGDTNEMHFTDDSGAHWTAITGPAAQAAVDALTCAVIDENRWYVGYDDGELWYTGDGGTNWSQITLGIPASGHTISAINDMGHVGEHVIWLAIHGNDGVNEVGFVGRSVTGGATDTWEYTQAPSDCGTGNGFLAIHVCGVNQAFAVGCVETTSYIFEVAET